MDTNKPLRNSDILLQEIGDEVFLYNPGNDALHVLNTTALSVWNQCDGSHTVKEIENHLNETYQFAENTNVYSDVMDIMQTFTDLGVLA